MRQRRPEPTTLWTTAPSCRARAVRFPRAAEHQSHRQRSRQFRGRRSELERLIDLTVLEPTHPQLGTCWRFMGTPRHTGASPRLRTVTPTGSAGSSFAVPSQKVESSTTDAASMPAGILTTWNSSPTRRTSSIYARRTAGGENLRIGPNGGASLSGLQRSEPTGVPGTPTRPPGPFWSFPIVSVMLTAPGSALPPSGLYCCEMWPVRVHHLQRAPEQAC